MPSWHPGNHLIDIAGRYEALRKSSEGVHDRSAGQLSIVACSTSAHYCGAALPQGRCRCRAGELRLRIAQESSSI